MFGETYTYQKQPKILEDGDYTIRLAKPFETQVAGFNVLRFPFAVVGVQSETVPNYFDLFDCVDPKDPEKLAIFNKSASRIKACFNLGGHFSEANYIKWTGSIGKVRIEKTKSGFVNVVTFYKAILSEEEENNL